MRPPTTLGSNSARQRELIDAAIAVNEAPSLDEAFQVLADTGLALLQADRLSVVVWDETLRAGVVRADASDGRSHVGAVFGERSASAGTLADGGPRLGAVDTAGLPTEVAEDVSELASVVRIPLVTPSCRATFHAGWRRTLDDAELEEAASLLTTLTRLTTVAERTLREREQVRLESVLGGVADGVIVSDGATSTANAAAREILALPDGVDFRSALFNPRTLDGRPYEVSLADAPGGRALAKSPKASFRIRATALDGRELVLDGTVSQAGPGVVIVFRDITAEYRARRLNEEMLSALFDGIPLAIAVVHPRTYEVVAVNRSFCELVGRPVEELLGAGPPYPWWNDDSTTPLAVGEHAERILRRADGTPHPVELSIHAIEGEDGSPALLLGLFEDVAAERRLQQQLVQSGKLAAIGELAAGVAHEINNPLFAILGLTEFLLKESEPSSRARQRLELIQQTGLEIKEIVRALLDFARENADERHVLPLEDVVRSTVDLVRRTNAHKGVELIDTYDESAALISASPNQLKQIFLNLIANARQAMPNGGNVVVHVGRDGDEAVATVSDSGPGIPPEQLGRIFEPFYTTKRHTGGTGLGLSVSLGIAEAHGGSLTACSEPGRGAVFTLRLPVATEDAA